MNGTLVNFEITPDSSQVVYRASQDTVLVPELYVVPLSGGESIKLNDPLVAGGFVYSSKVSPDGSRVVYTADQDVDNQWEIFSVSLIDPAAAPVKLNPPLDANRDVVKEHFRISSDGSQVVYLADKEVDDNNLFYSVPIGGGTSVKLSQVTHGVPVLFGEYTFEISPDSSRLVFRATKWGITEVFSVPLTGGQVIKLNAPIIPANGKVDEFKISPDSSRVIYLATQQTTARELYSVPIAGGPVAKLNGALPNTGYVVAYLISDDSQKVVYWADQQVAGIRELFSVPLADGEITPLNPPLVNNGWVRNFQISPNSNHVLYVADQETAGVPELFVTFEESPPPPSASYQAYMPFARK
jgi:Tol biopolymer transport system component